MIITFIVLKRGFDLRVWERDWSMGERIVIATTWHWKKVRRSFVIRLIHWGNNEFRIKFGVHCDGNWKHWMLQAPITRG